MTGGFSVGGGLGDWWRLGWVVRVLMLWTTKVFHAGPPRVSRLTKNIVLPRSIPLPAFVATPVGVALGYAVFGVLKGLLGWLPFAGSADLEALKQLFVVLGGGTAAVLATAQPWRGEHVHRVAAVRAAAIATTRRLLCPGSAMPTVYSGEVGTLTCCECRRVFTDAQLFAPQHEWSRRVYLGMRPIPHPTTGEVHVVSGSIPARVGSNPHR